MSLNRFVAKEKRKRRNFQKNEQRKKILYFLLQQKGISPENRSRLSEQLFKYRQKKQVSFVSLNNFCMQTSNTHSVYKQFSLSRWALKDQFHRGFLTGLRKKS